MADQDYSNYYQPSGSAVTAPSTGLGTGLSDQTPTPPTTSSYEDYYKPSSTGAATSSPLTGQASAPALPSGPMSHLYQDPNQGWGKRAWDFANTPLTESLFGLPEDRPGAGGFERGIEHIAGGLTSPLSIALTAATFGTGGFIESAGANALKEAGLSAEEIAQVTKGSQAALQAFKDQKSIEPAIQSALEAGGHDLSLLQKAREAVGPLNRDAEFGNPTVQKFLSEHKFTSDEISDLSKASDTVAEARTGFKPIEDAVREAGVDPALWKRGQDVLYKNGLNENDLLGGSLVDRGAYQLIRKTVPDLSIASSARAAKTASALMNAGFTYQQLESASAMTPQFLDALKEGDYDKALEYGTEAFASGTLGILGATHALHSAGELFKPLIENSAPRPSDEWVNVQRSMSEKEAQHAIGDQQAISLDNKMREMLGHAPPGALRQIFGDKPEFKDKQDLELASVFHQIVTGGDREKAANWFNSLAEAIGSDERISANQLPKGPEGGSPLTGQPNPDVQKLAANYTSAAGINKTPHEGLIPVDTEASKKVADAYEKMQHNPDDPEVKASYDALKKETKDQWDAAKAAGYTLEPWTKEGQPYANSAEMAEDVRNNKHLYYFQGGELPEGHPLAETDPETGESYNNIFRAVHDLFGHAKQGYEFGARGEENAFLAHSRMYSDAAIPALLSETKGQNSWVNFGKHLRDEEGNLPTKGEEGYVAPPARPYAEQKAGILPPEIVNQHLGQPPSGTPLTETPSRTTTRVIHSNAAGEVRIGTDGRPVVWLSPEHWSDLQSAARQKGINGISYSPSEAADVVSRLPKKSPVRDLFNEAQKASKQKLLTGAEAPGEGVRGQESYIRTVAEELQHTWQRELAQDGEIENHLDPEQWRRLYDIIPQEVHNSLDEFNYPQNPIVRVAETAAKFLTGQHYEYGASDQEVDTFLKQYFKEVEAKHGANALDAMKSIGEVARQHVEDIYADQDAARTKLADEQTDNGIVERLHEGRERSAGVGEEEPGGARGEEPEGLASRETAPKLSPKEEEEFGKLSKLRLRVGMGDPGSAAIVTPEGKVALGRDHADLLRGAGYKATPTKDLYRTFFDDGGVRIRTGGGNVHVDFMDSSPKTWGNVYKSILSSPEASRYYVDFRSPEGGRDFNVSAYDKDNLLYKLQDVEEGRARPTRAGSVSSFRDVDYGPVNGLFSRERENIAPQWYLKSNQLIDSRMQGPMPADTVLKQGQPLFARNRPVNGQLPPNIDDMIQNNKFKDLPKDYQTRIMESLRRVAQNQLSDREMQTANALKYEYDKNFQIGSSSDMIHHYIQDYATRLYEDNNPGLKTVLAQAKAGKFATNVSMAKQRVYDSHITALLKSPKQMKLDPITGAAKGRGEVIKAAANKQLIDNLRDNFTRASDGRPALYLAGSGSVVSGENGENPTTFVSPDRIRKLQISDSAVEAMKQSGDLQRFLEDGTVKDLTPKVYKGNIGTAIDRLEEEGISKEAQYDPEGNNILRKNIQLLKDVRDGQRPYSDLKEYNDSMKPMYAFDPQDYVSLNHGAFKDWKFVTNDTAGNKVMVNSDIRVHPEFADYLKNRLGLEPSPIAKNPIGKALLRGTTATKHVLLSLSPFHMTQIALRGLMTGINPFTLEGPDIINGAKVDPSDPKSETKINAMTRNGYTTGTDYRGQQNFTEGVAGGELPLLRKIPGVGPILANSMNFYNDLLFRRFLPAIKATAAEKMFDDYRSAHPDWSTDRVARAAGLHANDSFGGVNWKALGRSATSQDMARIVLLAPDWFESEIRSGARLFNKEEGGIGRAQVIKMAGAMWLMARVLNKMTTGSYHQEAPFSLATKSKNGKEVLWSMRTLPQDLLHMATDPVNFIKGRLSPTVHLGQEIATGRDNYGRKMAPEDLWADAFRQMSPIPVQDIAQAVTSTGPEVGNAGQWWKAAGGTATNYQTPAGKMAADLAASHSEDGLVDPSQQQRHRMVMDFEDKARTGEISWPDLMKMTYGTDQLKESELQKIKQNLSKTKGMDSTIASLYTRASRLPAKEYLDLYQTMNPTERAALAPLTIQVQKRYLAKAKKDMTPQERAQDPVFQKLLNMIPHALQTQQQ